MQAGHDNDDMEFIKYKLAKVFHWQFHGLTVCYSACSGIWKGCTGRLDAQGRDLGRNSEG